MNKLAATLLAFTLTLTACSAGAPQSFEGTNLVPNQESVNMEQCWRTALLDQSIKYPSLRSFESAGTLNIDLNSLELETEPQFLPNAAGNEQFQKCVQELGSGSVTLGDINNDGLVDILGSLGNTWITTSEQELIYSGSPYGSYNYNNFFNSFDYNNPVLPDRTGPSGIIADFNNDGINEVVLTNTDRRSTQPLLFFNYIDNKWVDVTPKFPIEATPSYRVLSAMGVIDYNKDGFLDIIIGHSTLLLQVEALNSKPEDYQLGIIVLRNEQGKGFVDVTRQLGLEETVLSLDLGTLFSDGHPQFFPKVYTLDFGVADLDNDSWPDIVVIGDFGTSFILWNEQGSGFSSNKNSVIPSASAMGIAFYDVNKDGLLDFVITQIYDEDRIHASCPYSRPCGSKGNIFMISQGPRVYKDFGKESGIFDGAWGWGVIFQDLDNDGMPEILQTSGQLVAEPGAQWKFREGDFFVFKQVSPSNGSDAGLWVDASKEFGLDLKRSAASVVSYDFFNQGLPDIVIGPRSSNNLLYFSNNLKSEGNWISVKPLGRPEISSYDSNSPKSTPQAWGALIEVSAGSNYW